MAGRDELPVRSARHCQKLRADFPDDDFPFGFIKMLCQRKEQLRPREGTAVVGLGEMPGTLHYRLQQRPR